MGSEKLGQSKLHAVVADFQCLEWNKTFQGFSLLQEKHSSANLLQILADSEAHSL